MKWYKNLKTVQKLMGGFCLVALLAAFIGYKGVSGMALMDELMGGLLERDVKGVLNLKEAQVDHILITRAVRTALLENDAAGVEKRVADVKKNREEHRKHFEDYRNTIVRPEVKVKAGEFVKLFDEISQIQDQILGLAQGGKMADAKALFPKVNEVAVKMDKELKELGEARMTVMKKAVDDAKDIYASSRNLMIGMIAGAMMLAIGVGFMIARLIAQPLNQAVGVLQAVASGDLTRRLELDTKDEVGQMATALNQALDSLGTAMRTIGESAHSVASSSEELTSVSHQMSSNSEETAAQANVVSAASEQVSKSVQTVAAGAEEMSASIKEIAKSTTEAARVAKEAVQVAEKTNATITKLGESSAEIGNVIKVITSIAEQTNLLALNATIEAARAGEAGKGFAVVANEVKELAKQTGEATEDISNKVGAIQHDAQGAVAAIQQISGIINQVNDIANTIASAVEEQSVTTNEMSRNVGEAAKGSNEIVANITGVAQAAQSTASGATETQAAAQELARLATELQAAVNQFKYDADRHESKLVVKVKEKAPKAPHTPQHQPKPTYRPADTTLHAL